MVPRTAVVLIGVTLALSACAAGTDEPDGDTTGPTVVDARFDGDFSVVALQLDGSEVALSTVPGIAIESVFGGLTVKPGCNTYFGSLTLIDDGAASFTITGGSAQDCGSLTDQERLVLDGLARVDRWEATDEGFRLTGPGAVLVLVR